MTEYNFIRLSGVGMVLLLGLGIAMAQTPVPNKPPTGAPSAKTAPATSTPVPATPTPATPGAMTANTAIPPPPELPVRSYILMDFHSGRVLSEHNSEQPVDPASITKLMTGYVIYNALKDGKIKVTDPVTVSAKARQVPGSRMFIEVNTQVSVEDLLLGMVVQSGNDATIALAEHVAGSEITFVELMNRQAAELGMTHSHFTNTTGLPDPNHHMSARDIALLGRALIKNFPQDYGRYSVRSFTYNKIEQPNRNRLLWTDPSVDGIKTGYTDAAGYCLAASAKRGDTRLITVVLGAKLLKERFDASTTLLNYGFGFYETFRLYGANTPLAQARVWKGKVGELSLGLAEDLFITVPKGRSGDLRPTLDVSNTLIEAPVQQNTVVGKVTVALGDQPLAEAPLVTLQEVPEAGFLGRLIDQILLTFHRWF